MGQSFNQYTRYRYGTKSRYQSIRPPLTHAQGGLLLGVGDGGRVVRYRTLFLPKKSLRSEGDGSVDTFNIFYHFILEGTHWSLLSTIP